MKAHLSDFAVRRGKLPPQLCDWMFDRLNKENDGDFGVVVVQPIKEGSVVSLLNEQDGLYDLGLRGLIDGDLVVIRKQNYANVGDIVVALDDENQNTLKTLCFDEDERRYYLHPENEKYDDIYVNGFIVQGVAQHVIKKL